MAVVAESIDSLNYILDCQNESEIAYRVQLTRKLVNLNKLVSDALLLAKTMIIKRNAGS